VPVFKKKKLLPKKCACCVSYYKADLGLICAHVFQHLVHIFCGQGMNVLETLRFFGFSVFHPSQDKQ
jgi:hypothetical protein